MESILLAHYDIEWKVGGVFTNVSVIESRLGACGGACKGDRRGQLDRWTRTRDLEWAGITAPMVSHKPPIGRGTEDHWGGTLKFCLFLAIGAEIIPEGLEREPLTPSAFVFSFWYNSVRLTMVSNKEASINWNRSSFFATTKCFT